MDYIKIFQIAVVSIERGSGIERVMAQLWSTLFHSYPSHKLKHVILILDLSTCTRDPDITTHKVRSILQNLFGVVYDRSF